MEREERGEEMENEKKKGEKKKREGEDKEAVAYSVNLSESKIFLYLLALDYKGGQFPVLLWATLLLPIISTSFVLGIKQQQQQHSDAESFDIEHCKTIKASLKHFFFHNS